jgi:fucose 4-O-acetylase-like acetyltransferase
MVSPATTAPAQPVTPAAAEKAANAQAPRRKQRDPFFDNAKYLAILLVVIGHSLAHRTHTTAGSGLYLFIYLFHMPLFIVITGYFSRNWTFSGGKARKLITTVGVPYVIFDTAYSLAGSLGSGKPEVALLEPAFLTWFLCALFFWRLSTPVWQQIRWPLAVALAFSLLSYMTDLGDLLDLHRIIGLLPFYVLGLLLRPEHFELLKRPVARVLGWAVLAGAFVMSFVVMNHMARNWVYWKHPHDTLNVDNVTGTVMRLAMFAAALVLVAAFLAVVPRRRTWFTSLGANTLYAFLLHGFITRLLGSAGWREWAWLDTAPGLITVIAGAALMGTLLCSKPVVRFTRWAIEPKMTWAFTPLRRPAKR